MKQKLKFTKVNGKIKRISLTIPIKIYDMMNIGAHHEFKLWISQKNGKNVIYFEEV